MPYVKIMPPNKKHGNTGTCRELVNYLEKENQNNPEELFFNHHEDYIGKTKAEKIIAHDVSALGKKDAKFYEVIVAFSKEELKGRTDAELRNYLKANFAKDYCKSITGRDVDPNSLVFVAKLERERKYKGTDQEVEKKERKKGELKEGDNRHFHVIIARKTTEGKKISPVTTLSTANKGSVKSGFSQNGFKQQIEDSFDKSFTYERKFEEKFAFGKLSETEKIAKKAEKKIRKNPGRWFGI